MLDDADRDRLLEERVDPNGNDDGEEGPIIIPEPGDCPVMQWRETHTVQTDSSGEVISESWQVCTQCFQEDGTTPIGEETCSDEPPVPPDVICEEYKTDDPTVICYRCTAPDGEIVEDSCYQLPVECVTDADCPSGQVCYVYDQVPVDPGPGGPGCGDGSSGGSDDGGMTPSRDPNDPGDPGDPTEPPYPGMPVGYCAAPDPCQFVDTLPSDPTGESCWQCTDPTTGEDLGSWCDVHRCGDDGSCTNPWEVCDAASGYCVWDDPCDPVPSLPEDPTGQDCYKCEYPAQPGDPSDPMDPNGGSDGTIDGGGWCNVHTCTTDADCAPRGEACNEDTGFCEYVDPCTPVPSLPSDPTGTDCYQCTDPATGDDWGGYCNGHACNTDEDCYGTMAGDVCVEGTCAWSGGDDGGNGGRPPMYP